MKFQLNNYFVTIMLASGCVCEEFASPSKDAFASVDEEKKDYFSNVPLRETTVDESHNKKVDDSHSSTVNGEKPTKQPRLNKKSVTLKETQAFIEHHPKEEQKTQVVPLVRESEIFEKQHSEVFLTDNRRNFKFRKCFSDVNEIKRLYQKNPYIISQYILLFLLSVLVVVIICLAIYSTRISPNMTSQVNTTLGALNETTMHNISSITTPMSDCSPITELAPPVV